jgi:tRNA A37 threonylcarbamoyladenosine biosynthesis protein TsaE
MSLEQIRNIVENFINSPHNELLVIKGDWGAGKSHFWDELLAQSRAKGAFGREYYSRVSVFLDLYLEPEPSDASCS